MMKSLFILAIFTLPLFVCGYIESVAANVDDTASTHRRQSAFVPLVAFNCGFRNKYLSTDGHWVTDNNRYATCLTGKLDILKYCRKVYPKLDVTNIVEYSHESKIDDWCKEEGSPCKWTHTVRPYQCIVGEFRSEALQVPHGCRFGHVDDRQICEDYKHWQTTANQQCSNKRVDSKKMEVRSFAMLEPCGLDLFTGVEYVCCPSDAKEVSSNTGKEHVIDLDAQDDEDDYDSDEYYDDDDEDYDDDDDDDDDDDEKDPDEKIEQDPYFRTADPDNEHQMYKDALHRLERKHRDKVAKVMREWSELEERYKKMKVDDPKHADDFKQEMTDRFQKTVKALEDENKEQKRQIEEVHQERVQTSLNERKRKATREFRDALASQVDKIDKHLALKTLKAYIRAEEKDRTHMLNHYRHLLRSDPGEATATKDILLRRLRDIDLRVNGTLAMLRDFPELDRQVTPIAVEFWEQYRKENTPEVADESVMQIGGHEKNERLIELYRQEFEKVHKDSKEEDTDRELHVEIEPIVSERKPMIAHETLYLDDVPSFAQKDALVGDSNLAYAGEMTRSPRLGSSHALLLVAASATVVLALVALIFSRRRRHGPPGFIEVDAYTPEERHVSGMQVNGYENPTYSFFDRA